MTWLSGSTGWVILTSPHGSADFFDLLCWSACCLRKWFTFYFLLSSVWSLLFCPSCHPTCRFHIPPSSGAEEETLATFCTGLVTELVTLNMCSSTENLIYYYILMVKNMIPSWKIWQLFFSTIKNYTILCVITFSVFHQFCNLIDFFKKRENYSQTAMYHKKIQKLHTPKLNTINVIQTSDELWCSCLEGL